MVEIWTKKKRKKKRKKYKPLKEVVMAKKPQKFKIKRYPSKSKVRRMPLVGHGQGAKDITRGRLIGSGAGGGDWPIATTTTTTTSTTTTSTTTSYIPNWVQKDSEGQSTNQGALACSAAITAYIAGSWTAGSSYTLGRLVLRLGDPFMSASGITFTVEIRTHDGSDPAGSPMANGSSSIIGVSGAEAPYDIFFSPGPDLINGTKYCVVIHRFGVWDFNNNIVIYYQDTGGELMQRDADGVGAWTDTDTSSELALITYADE